MPKRLMKKLNRYNLM